MRLNFQQVRRSVMSSSLACAAALVPAALVVFAPLAQAQSVDPSTVPAASVASVTNAAADVVPVTTATLSPATTPTPSDATAVESSASAATAAPDMQQAGTADTNASDSSTRSAGVESAVLTFRPAADPGASGDDGMLAGMGALDDQTLSRQRGGAVGMVMVAATPQLMRGGNSVTLWDEIAPPAPLPIPVDAAQNAQGNVASYTRK
ncbi:hypothetical protein [Paraburkholderia acidisoli]|uniref:hypothetical protein n=1 Tax=Paraburkholderia acidisoli TaxID=2571748 RepID=UPI001E2ED2B5|nr:hypothetical protein [Paraburkholderia acidisoli]